MKIWIGTDSDGRILSSTNNKDYSEGMQEIEVPDDFDFDHQDDYLYKDGMLTYDQRPSEPPDPYYEYQRQVQASIPILTRYLSKDVTDEEVLQIKDLMPEYDENQTYAEGSVVQKDSVLYRKKPSVSTVSLFPLDSLTDSDGNNFESQWYKIQ